MIRKIGNLTRPSLSVRLLWLGDELLHQCFSITVLGSAALAAVVGLGAASRFNGPGWATMNATGGHLVWGILFLACTAALMLTPSRSVIALRMTLYIVAGIWLLWAIGLGVAASRSHQTAPYTGTVGYSTIAAICVAQGERYSKARR